MTSTRSTRQRLAMCTIWPSVNDHDARRSSISVAAHPRNVISNVSGSTRGKWASPIALNRRMCLSMPMLIKAPRGMRCQRAMDTVCRPSGKLGNRDAVTVPRARKSVSMISSLIVDDPGASVVPLPVSVHYEERRAHTAQPQPQPQPRPFTRTHNTHARAPAKSASPSRNEGDWRQAEMSRWRSMGHSLGSFFISETPGRTPPSRSVCSLVHRA